MLKLSNSLLHCNGKMMMMVFTNWILNDDQIKSLLMITLCTWFELLEKEIKKGFCVIDPLNEQHIVIIAESHDWSNTLKVVIQYIYCSPHLLTLLKLVE